MMMTTPNLLSDLKPIVLPPEPGIWPLAIGWWLLIIVLLVTLIITVNGIIKRRRFWAVKRQAIIQARSLTDHNQLNRLLKTVALHYYPANLVARLNGQSWADFLNQGLAPAHHRDCRNICTSLYQKPAADKTALDQRYQLIATAWLSGLSVKKIVAVKKIAALIDIATHNKIGAHNKNIAHTTSEEAQDA